MADQPEDTWTDTDRAMFIDQARKAMTAADARSDRLVKLHDVIAKVVWSRVTGDGAYCGNLVIELTAAVMGRAEQVADEREQQVRAQIADETEARIPGYVGGYVDGLRVAAEIARGGE